MGLRLTLLSLWTPMFIIHRQLDRVSDLTTAALKSLLKTNAPGQWLELLESNSKSTTVEEKRAAMAKEHVALTEALAKSLGRDQALQLGRASLFEVGQELGRDTRRRLGIGNSRKDLAKAAEILYRVFDIHVKVEWLEGEKAVLVVNRCRLAKEYSEFTCLVLSATDEGIVNGLSPQAHMTFRDRMTSGCPSCKADIEFNGVVLKK